MFYFGKDNFNPAWLDNIVLDWDDTLNDTYPVLKEEIVALGSPYHLPKDDGYLTDENTNGGLSIVLQRGEFMRRYCQRDDHQTLLTALENLRRAGSRIGICTHRGYHKDAFALSEAAFEEFGFKMDFIYVISSRTEPDKTEFLKRELGENFTLVDDNPISQPVDQLPPNVVLMSQAWNDHVDSAHRVESLKELSMWFYEALNRAVNPKYVCETLGLPWTVDDEIRLGRVSRSIVEDPRPRMEEIAQYLREQNMTASLWKATLGIATSENREKRFKTDPKLIACAHLLTQSPVTPISISIDEEWQTVPDGQLAGAFRSSECYRITENGQHTLVVNETVLHPDRFWTRWEQKNDTPHLSRTKELFYKSGYTPRVIYDSQGEPISWFTNGTVAKLYAERMRAEMVEDFLADGKNNPLSILNNSTTGLSLIALLKSHQTHEYILAVCRWADLYETVVAERDESLNTVGHVAELYKLRYPDSYDCIKDIMETHTSESVLPTTERRVKWVSVAKEVYLVNSKEGHQDAIHDWAKLHNQQPIEVPLYESAYPALITFTSTEANTTVRYVFLPLGDLTKAIQIVGLN